MSDILAPELQSGLDGVCDIRVSESTIWRRVAGYMCAAGARVGAVTLRDEPRGT